MARKKTLHQDVALEVVCNIGRAVAAEMDLPTLLELIYRETGRVMDTGCFLMGLYDPLEDGIRMELIYDRNERLAPLTARRAEGWGLVGRVFEERRPLLVSDVHAGPVPAGAIQLGDLPRSWLGVPLIARERAIGVVSVQSYEPDAFSAGDQAIMESIASQAAVAIENLFLRREHERRIAELSALNEIGRSIITATRVEDLLEVIYRETSRVMDTSNLYVALYHPESETVSFDYLMEDGRRSFMPAMHMDEGGLSVKIVETRQPIILGENVEEEMARLGIAVVGRLAQSYLGVPMLVGDRVVGVIAVQSPGRSRAYDKRHQDLLSNIANLAAVAIENTHLSEDRERRLTEMAMVNEIGQTLSSAGGLQELLEVVYQQVGRTFDTTNFYVALYDDQSELWQSALSFEYGQRQAPFLRSVNEGLTGYVIRNKKPLILRSIEDGFNFDEANNIQTIGQRPLSWMGVPLIARDRVVGVMGIQSYEQENLYGEHDLALFTTIAAQVAIAMENSRLFGELQTRLADLAVLNEVAQAILVAESQGDLLEAIHRQVGRVMDTTNLYVALYEEKGQMLDMAYFVEGGELSKEHVRYPISAGGLTAYLVQKREPLFLPRYSEEQLQEREIVVGGRVPKSYLGVPMVAAEQVIGAMAVQNYEQEDVYTARHLALLTNIATEAAVAVQRIRLRTSEARKAQQLATIGEVGRKVTAILDLDELLRELARSIQLGFGYANVAVLRVDEEEEELVLGALVGRYAGIMEWGFRQPIGEGLIGWTAKHGQLLNCGNVTEDARYVRGFDAEEATLSEMCVPISYGSRTIGVLDVQAEEVDAFDAEDVAAMETLAGQLAAAMRNAILFRERGEQLANVNGLNRVIQATASALKVEDLITALCDVVAELMNPDTFFVALRNKETGTLDAPLVLDEGVFYRNAALGEKGFTAYLLRTGQPVFIHNMATEAAGYPVEPSTQGSGKVTATWLGVPLQSGQDIIGAIVVQSYRPYAFGDRDLEFLQSAASQVVVSIEKARLFEETQHALNELREANERQNNLLGMVRELSTPLVPVTEDILVLPLVGTIDSLRAQQIMDVLLEGISERRARVVIVDITGVPIVDTSVANYILQATQAVGLLGAKCILVGITPEVAQTVVSLGVDLLGLTTRSDLQGGIEYALRLMGQRIVKQEKRAPLPDKAEAPGARTPERTPRAL